MTLQAILSMILIVGFVVGGFAFFLRMAIQKEAAKKKR